MDGKEHFFSIRDLEHGIPRELTQGISTRIFVGEQAMLSVVSIEADARGKVHSHPEEQWGYLLEGSGIRVQDGKEHAVTAGDFWRTPGGVPHGFIGGESGAKILDIFSPPREEYRKQGQGYQ